MTTDLIVGRGVSTAGRVLAGLDHGAVAIITHPGAEAIAARLAEEVRALGTRAEASVVPDGDAAKAFSVVENLIEWLSSVGIRRDGLIIGVGGGAVTDLAGFVAAVYLRGVAVVYVPTTLLGAVDASIGGKTGVNVGGKNLAGVFRHPVRVVVDVDILDALPVHLKRHGFVEALKAGLVGDAALVDLIESDGLDADLELVVRRALAVKEAIVGRDFEESAERIYLNYGHTIGHAVEFVLGWPHGDAVAVGMVAAGRVSAELCGFVGEKRQRVIIASLGSPVVLPAVDRSEIHRLLGRDKKRDGAGLRMVLLEAVGVPKVAHVDATTVDRALDAITTGGRR